MLPHVDVNLNVQGGNTALILAAGERYRRYIVRLVLQRDDIDVNYLQDDKGRTALTPACANGHT